MSDIFFEWTSSHFLKFAQRPSPEDKLLLIFDGHKSHVSIKLLDWAKQNNVVLFVLPAHTSHVLQPLDVTCFGPMERSFNRGKHTLMKGHSGFLTNKDICSEACKAYRVGVSV